MMFLASLAILTATAVKGVMSEESQGSWEDSVAAEKENVTLPSFYLEVETILSTIALPNAINIWRYFNSPNCRLSAAHHSHLVIIS